MNWIVKLEKFHTKEIKYGSVQGTCIYSALDYATKKYKNTAYLIVGLEKEIIDLIIKRT